MNPAARLDVFRTSDGYAFYFRHFPAASSSPRGRIIFIHGIRSHGGWYSRSCQAFADAGFDVYFLDRRGAGLNTAHRGDAPAFRRLLDDVAEFIQHLREEKAYLPVVVGGISWGGKIAVALPYRKPGLVDGLLLMCPGLVPIASPPFLSRVRIAIARVLRPWKLFPIPLNEPDLFTVSPEWQRFIDSEPHGLRLATSRFLFSSFSLDIYLKRAAKRIAMPSLLLLAEHDRIINNSATRGFTGRFPTPPTILEYPSSHHTLEFEGESHPWIADAVKWIERSVLSRCPAPPAPIT